ncbi:unnamed protein product, partial [Larinioides sclopetarius]
MCPPSEPTEDNVVESQEILGRKWKLMKIWIKMRRFLKTIIQDKGIPKIP